jgi:hypothetical protein
MGSIDLPRGGPLCPGIVQEFEIFSVVREEHPAVGRGEKELICVSLPLCTSLKRRHDGV